MYLDWVFYSPAFILLIVLWASWICGLQTLIWRDSLLLVSNISSVPFSLSSPSGIPTTYMSCLLELSHSPWIFCSVFFPCLFSLCFSILEHSIDMFSSSEIHPSVVANLLMNLSRARVDWIWVFTVSHMGWGRRQWHPTPVLLPGKSHGRRSLVGCRVTKSRTRLSDFTFTSHFHALEEEMATHSSVLAWRIPGTGEPGELLSMGSHRVGHDWSDLAAAHGMGG